jgi:hypothetical protein
MNEMNFFHRQQAGRAYSGSELRAVVSDRIKDYF